jgi:hypothetical protein
VQTPLSDEPADDSVDDEDKDCTDFSELLEDSGTFSDDESAELELGADFAELLEFFAELDKATEQLDCSSIEDTDDEDSSPTAAGEPSDESPHATSANGTASKPASNEAITATEAKRSFNFITLIYIKKRSLENCVPYLKLRNWSFLDHV